MGRRMKLACRLARRVLQAEFVGARALMGGGWARSHARGCDACERWYDLLADVERVGLQQAPLPDRVVDRVESAILRDSNRARPGEARPLYVVAAWAAFTLVITTAVLVAGRPQTEFQPRRSTGAAGSVRLFCLDAGGVVVGSASPGQSLSCPRSGFVQASYRSVDGGFLAIIGIDASQEMHWYHGPRSGPASVPLQPSATEVILPSSVRLAANHRPGVVKIRAFFVARPPADADAARALWLTATDVDLPPLVLSVTAN